MKEQYVGDISDYRKYALLRRLQEHSGLRLGVCWMLTPSDGGRDGNKVAYLDQPHQRDRDPAVFDVLRLVRDQPEGKRLTFIEDSGIFPGAIYENALVPDALASRKSWFTRASERLAGVDLIFFDPDNGLDVRSKPKGRLGSSKYLFRDEVEVTYSNGNSLLIYQHFPMELRMSFVARTVVELRRCAPSAEVWAFRTPYVVFVLLIHPDHHPALHQAAQSVSDTFDPKFIAAAHHPIT